MLRIMIDIIPWTRIPSPSNPQIKIKAKNTKYLNKDRRLKIWPDRITLKRNEVDAEKWSREKMKSFPVFGDENTEKR